MTKRLQVYATDEITVTFAPDACMHSGVCLRGLPAVFDVGHRRWVQPENAPAVEVAAQVAKCPSGALQYQMKGKPVAARHEAANAGGPYEAGPD